MSAGDEGPEGPALTALRFPFGDGELGSNRPYLVLNVHGPAATLSLRGLVDTGADQATLPLGAAAGVGLTMDDLSERVGRHVGGPFTFWEPREPLHAQVPGLRKRFVIQPSFIDSPEAPALWGRLDFMAAYDFLFSQTRRCLSLKVPNDDFDESMETAGVVVGSVSVDRV